MSSLGSPNPFFIAGKKAYEVERSLRFNPADIANLERTFGSAGNRRTWTFSFWYKRSGIGRNTDLFSPYRGGEGTQESRIYFQSNDQLRIYDSGGLSGYPIVRTAAKFRDVGAWYHFVVAVDTTQSTASNRVKIYANNVLQELDETTYGNQNQQLGWNNNLRHRVGAYGNADSLSSSNINSGYMAEVNFIDGFQYDPSYFGETDVITGQWNPKKYTGSYGTNGFYLNFSDNSGTTATTLGKDSSGNGNNFTPNNFSTHDSVPDSPTNNFCTGNSIGRTYTNAVGNNPNYSEGNLEFETAGNSSHAYGTMAVNEFLTSGCYFEILLDDLDTSRSYVGIVDSQSSANDASYGFANKAIIRHSMVVFFGTATDGSGSYDSGVADCSNGDIIGVAIKGTSIWFHKNGTYIPNSSGSTGNPSTGANAAITSISNITTTKYLPYAGYNSDYTFNFGQDSSFAGAKTAQGNVDGNGKGDFYYPVPTGFVALCSANMSDPTIKLPNKHFDILTYAGNSTDNRAITGLNFQPDWVWIKKRTSSVATHWIVDALRANTDNSGNGNVGALASNSSDGEQSHPDGGFESFDSNGFTLGKGSNNANADSAYQRNNASSMTYVAWNWDAGETDGKTYTVTVVSDSGNKYRFDGFGTSAVTLDLAEGGTYIFNYPSAHPFRFSETADGTHGGGSEYTTGVTVLSSTSIQIVVAASAPNLNYYCSSHSGMGGAINTNSTLGSSNFDGTGQVTAKVNAQAGFSILTYSGTGSAGTKGHGLGVAPQAIITKRKSGAEDWKVYHQDIPGGYFLKLNATQVQTSNSDVYPNTAPTSSVYSLGNHISVNASGSSYVSYCFSEVAGYSKFGSYVSNGNVDGAFVFTGFRPAWVMLKQSNNSDTAYWFMFDSTRSPKNVIGDEALAANLTEVEGLTSWSPNTSNSVIDFLSNGFKIRTTSTAGFNVSGETMIYFAFAESPFKNARAR